MQIIKQFGWVYYVGETADQLDEHKCGKWMYFFGDVEFAEKICKAAVENGVVAESKHSDAPEGVCCFYSNRDDVEADFSAFHLCFIYTIWPMACQQQAVFPPVLT